MFHLHLTALTDVYEKELIHGLISKGYSVAPASDLSMTLKSPGVAGALISLQVENNAEAKAVSIYEDVVGILNEIKAKYYSLIITKFSYDSIWAGGNFGIFPEKESKIYN